MYNIRWSMNVCNKYQFATNAKMVALCNFFYVTINSIMQLTVNVVKLVKNSMNRREIVSCISVCF